jgi:hypothetical protein
MEIIQQSQSGDFRTEKCVCLRERQRETESSKTVVVSLELNSRSSYIEKQKRASGLSDLILPKPLSRILDLGAMVEIKGKMHQQILEPCDPSL